MSMTTMNEACPNRMDLMDIIKYCMDKNLRSVARWAADLIDQPGTIKRYYIDTQIVKNMFSVGEDTRLFRELECEVSTHVGMKG